MSLARSASGPGGLTINTGVTNTLTNVSPPLSSTPAAQNQSAGGLFGSGGTAAANSNAAPGAMSTTGGLFGAVNTQPKTGTGLFGASTAQAPSTGTTGLFGAAQQKPATGGLFGNSTAAATPAQQQQGQTAPASGGLFGSAQTQQKPAGGLFGTAAASQPTTNTTGASALFGGGGGAAQPSTGLFGASTTNAQQAKPSGGLFGQGQPQTLATNQVPAVQINYDNLRPRSRFDDLAQPIQDEVALIDKGIQRVIKMRDEIGEFMPQHAKDIEQLSSDVKFVESKFRMVQEALSRDIQTVKSLQDVTKKNIGDAQLSFKATDNLKLPSHYHQTGLFAGSAPSGASGGADAAASTHANAQDLITYFNRICDDVERYKTRLDDYRGEIERDMPGVENGLYEQIRSFRDRNAAAAHGGGGGGGGGGAVQDQLNQVLSALRETGNAIVSQAGQIADARERLSRLQAGFLDSGLYSAS